MAWKLFKNTTTTTPTQQEIEDSFWNGTFSAIGLGEYSDVILKLCIAPIIDELKKVEFYTANPVYEQQTKDIVKFLNNKYAVIYKYFFKKGYCAVKIGLDGSILFDDACMVKKISDYESELTNPISAMSFEYDFFGKSQFSLLDSIFNNIDTGLTAQKAITKILGQFTIFNKEITKDGERETRLTDFEKKSLVNKFNTLFTGKNVGTAVDFVNANLKRDTILFPLDKLQITDQVTFNILIIAGVVNVPYDLIPLTGKSTYANQEAAKQYLRANTVNGIAENMLELGKKILTEKTRLVPKNAIDFRVIESAVVNQPIQ